ncbi:MAG TPA: glycosyltransferase [Thermoanaerobaculia bacterium]|nr:glycosyltransferase [Thermoanaerobaculia bacterium]
MKVTVIMPVERIGGDAERAIAAVLAQRAPFAFELIAVSAAPLPLLADNRIRNVVEPDRNPATRRNRAASEARGEILAFVDDDAFADVGWLATAVAWLDEHKETLALGGPDPAPAGSPAAELISETLLATPWIGSGIVCHENRPGIFPIRWPSDIALVNLFVRREAFEAAGGFDESIGYIGEDTGLIAALMQGRASRDEGRGTRDERQDARALCHPERSEGSPSQEPESLFLPGDPSPSTRLGMTQDPRPSPLVPGPSKVIYHSGVVVYHRRRPFPAAYLRQRWRYRVKTGEMLARGANAYRRSGRVWALLIAGVLFAVAVAAAPRLALALLACYAPVTLILGARTTRLPPVWWPLLPFAFLAHHATYFAGIVWGVRKRLVRKK